MSRLLIRLFLSAFQCLCPAVRASKTNMVCLLANVICTWAQVVVLVEKVTASNVSLLPHDREGFILLYMIVLCLETDAKMIMNSITWQETIDLCLGATFSPLPCTCRWWWVLITQPHWGWWCSLCRAGGAESICTEGSCWLSSFGGDICRCAGQEGCYRKRRDAFWLSEGVVPYVPQRVAKQVWGPWLSFTLRDYSLFSSTSSALWGHAYEGRRMIQVSEAKFVRVWWWWRLWVGLFGWFGLTEVIVAAWLTMKLSIEWKV